MDNAKAEDTAAVSFEEGCVEVTDELVESIEPNNERPASDQNNDNTVSPHQQPPISTFEINSDANESNANRPPHTNEGLQEFPGDPASLLPTISDHVGDSSFSLENTMESSNADEGALEGGRMAESATNTTGATALSNTSAPNPPAEEQQRQEHQEQDSTPQTCQICGKDSTQDPRAMVRFLPSSTVDSDISMHVFCGKTASILPHVAKPHLEILLKAGLKNKHGIGPDVNFALARTRSAIPVGGGSEKDPKRLEKEYYLVKEFEGHLSSIRNMHVQREQPPTYLPPPHVGQLGPTAQAAMPPHPGQPMGSSSSSNTTTAAAPRTKPRVHKVARSKQVKHPSPAHEYHQQQQHQHPPQQQQPAEWINVHDPLTSQFTAMGNGGPSMATAMHHAGASSESKVRCPCGGLYWPPGTPKGASSWRSHLRTKKHQMWEQEQEQLQLQQQQHYYGTDASIVIPDHLRNEHMANLEYAPSHHIPDQENTGNLPMNEHNQYHHQELQHQQQLQQQQHQQQETTEQQQLTGTGTGDGRPSQEDEDEYSQEMMLPNPPVDV